MLSKNAAVPGVLSSSLGFGQGDNLLTQVEDQILERRKRSLAPVNQAPAAFGAPAMGISPAPGGALSPAIQSLLGTGGIGG